MEDGISSRGVVSRRRWLPVIGLTGLGLALRIVGLRAKAYWTDEIATVDLVRGGVGHAMSDLAHMENTPPLYYVLAWPWAHLFGTSEVGLRSLSTVFSVALIPVAYLIGGQLVGSRVGLVAAALVATNPMLVWYGQEARAYALLSLLTGVCRSFSSCARLTRRASGRLVAWVFPAASWSRRTTSGFLVRRPGRRCSRTGSPAGQLRSSPASAIPV